MTQRSKDGNAYTPQAEASWMLPRSPTYHLQINHLFLFKAFLPNAFYFFLGLTFAGGQSASLLLGYVGSTGSEEQRVRGGFGAMKKSLI